MQVLLTAAKSRSAVIGTTRSEGPVSALLVEMCMVQQSSPFTRPQMSRTAQSRPPAAYSDAAQALVVQALHEAALRAEPWQSGKAILRTAGSKSLCMADVFKSQKNWQALIRPDRRGADRLNVDQVV